MSGSSNYYDTTPLLHTFLYPSTVFFVPIPLIFVGLAGGLFTSLFLGLIILDTIQPLFMVVYVPWHLYFWQATLKNPYIWSLFLARLRVMSWISNGHFFGKSKGHRYVA